MEIFYKVFLVDRLMILDVMVFLTLFTLIRERIREWQKVISQKGNYPFVEKFILLTLVFLALYYMVSRYYFISGKTTEFLVL